MLNKSELLKSIELSGGVDSLPEKKVLINSALEMVLDRSTGKTRIRPSKVKLFSLIYENIISGNNLDLRCLNCGKVITLPAWHLKIELNRNEFHYFVCLNTKVNVDFSGCK